MSILNTIISFFLIVQLSSGNLEMLFNISNIFKVNTIHSVESCGADGSGCQLFTFLWFKKCICPPKPKSNLP